MINRRHLGWAAAAMAAAILSGTAAIAADAKTSHRWRIEVSESANSDGTLRFAVTPVGGESKTIEVPIKNGRSENHVAQDIRDAMKGGLSAEYHVEVDDGEDVLIKVKNPMPKFTVALLDSTVKSVHIHVETE
jgi:hypothetical protein